MINPGQGYRVVHDSNHDHAVIHARNDLLHRVIVVDAVLRKRKRPRKTEGERRRKIERDRERYGEGERERDGAREAEGERDRGRHSKIEGEIKRKREIERERTRDTRHIAYSTVVLPAQARTLMRDAVQFWRSTTHGNTNGSKWNL